VRSVLRQTACNDESRNTKTVTNSSFLNVSYSLGILNWDPQRFKIIHSTIRPVVKDKITADAKSCFICVQVSMNDKVFNYQSKFEQSAFCTFFNHCLSLTSGCTTVISIGLGVELTTLVHMWQFTAHRTKSSLNTTFQRKGSGPIVSKKWK